MFPFVYTYDDEGQLYIKSCVQVNFSNNTPNKAVIM